MRIYFKKFNYLELSNSFNEILEENQRLYRENKILKTKLNLYRKIVQNKYIKGNFNFIKSKEVPSTLPSSTSKSFKDDTQDGEIDIDFSYCDNDDINNDNNNDINIDINNDINNDNNNDINNDDNNDTNIQINNDLNNAIIDEMKMEMNKEMKINEKKNVNTNKNVKTNIYINPTMNIEENDEDTPFFRPEKNIKRKKYSIMSKYRILQELNGITPSQLSKKYDIPITTLKGWIKNQEKYQNQILHNKGNKERLVGGGRKITDPEYETFLINWIKSERLKKHQISYFRFKQFAKEHYKGNLLTFSVGWLQKFLTRNGLSYRKRTSTCFLNEDKVLQEIQEQFFPELYFYHATNPNKTVYYNMDEIRIELDCISDKTIDLKGSRYIPVKTSNSERKAYTVALCISSEGKKLKPFILFDGMGTKLMKELDPKGAVIQFTAKVNSSYMNADLFKKWCERVYDAEVSLEEKENSILFLDKCGSIHDKYSPKNTTLVFFPANSTKFLQPLDLGVNKVVKGKFKQFWEKWMASNNKTNSFGHVKMMDRQTFIDGICEVWDGIDTNTVKNAFNEIKRGLKAIEEDIKNNNMSSNMQNMMDNFTKLKNEKKEEVKEEDKEDDKEEEKENVQ